MKEYINIITKNKFAKTVDFEVTFGKRDTYYCEVENGFICFHVFGEYNIDFAVLDKKKKLISMVEGINHLIDVEFFQLFVCRSLYQDYLTVSKYNF